MLKEFNNEYEDENQRIRVFLKIKPSLASDKIFYNVSRDKKTISLLDNISLDDQKKTKKIELNKIFTHNDENSYIYEEIMRNCVKNSLDGENFTFISYGDSYSEKHNLIIGSPDCYENISNRGILPRLLEIYVNKIDSSEILYDSISLNISYILINNNNLIDLSQLMGRESKALEKITRDELIKKYSKEIKIDDKNKNYLKSIIKTPIVKANDSLFFLLQILNLFYKLEASNNHFLTWSYFIVIIYVTDNNGKTVSTLTFIIMPGNEILLHRFPKRKSFIGTERNDSISRALKSNAFECLYAIEDILEFLDAKYLNENSEENKDKLNEKNKDKNKKNIKINKKEIKSKLFNIIGNLAFDVNNKSTINVRRYIIIGSIFGNSGYITNIKDTLNFLLECQKFSQQKVISKNKKEDLFDYTFFNEKLKVKDEQIYDLQSKLKSQESKVEELNNVLENKEANLKSLKDNYKKQIELLKEEFNFSGDIDNLLKGDKNTKEYQYGLKIRNATDSNRLKNLKIEELKQQIIQIETVIKKFKTLLDIKKNDSTMLEIIKTIRESKEKKRKDMNIRNALFQQIENLTKKNKMLESKILGFKNEINYKKKLLDGLPELFKVNTDSKKILINFEDKINDINNDYSLKIAGINNEGIKKLEKEENKEKNIILDKYESILMQNKNEIVKIGNKIDNINISFKTKRKSYLDELVFLYKCIINIIKLYRNSFITNCSIFMNKEKFDRLLEKEEKRINPFVFPLLYDELGKISYGHFQLNNKKIQPKKKIIKSKYYKDLKEEIEDNNENEQNNSKGKKFSFIEKSKKNERIHKIIEQIKKGNLEQQTDKISPLLSEIIKQRQKAFHGIVKKNNFQLSIMNREDLQQYSKNFTEKIESVENFINNYIENIDSNSKFDPVQEKINEINEKLKKLNNKIKEITNKYQNNNIIFENGDKIIQRLENENYLLRKQINENNKKIMYSSTSPESSYKFNNNRFRKRNYSNKNLKINLNNFNTVLTTASSNNGILNQFNIINSPRNKKNGNYLYANRNDKMTFEANDFYSKSDKGDFFKNRVTSSYNKISPYYIVSENL